MVESQETEKDIYGRAFPKKDGAYHVPRTAADCVVVRPKDGKHEVLLITRAKFPSVGKKAFPGGHIDYNEDPRDAAIRELKEECSIDGTNPVLFTVRGKPDRDARYHMISIFYFV